MFYEPVERQFVLIDSGWHFLSPVLISRGKTLRGISEGAARAMRWEWMG